MSYIDDCDDLAYALEDLNLSSALDDSRAPTAQFYVICDFECTCEESTKNYPHEIIEFPALILSLTRQTPESDPVIMLVSTFNRFVKPTKNPTLSPFCTILTGISQDQVDAADTFETVLEGFEAWIDTYMPNRMFVFCNDGQYDVEFLKAQCERSKIKYPKWAKKYCDVRKLFCKHYVDQAPTTPPKVVLILPEPLDLNQTSTFVDLPKYEYEMNVTRKFVKKSRKKGLKYSRRNPKDAITLANMLAFFSMQFEGVPHCGRDDTFNISRIVRRILEDGHHVDTDQLVSSE